MIHGAPSVVTLLNITFVCAMVLGVTLLAHTLTAAVWRHTSSRRLPGPLVFPSLTMMALALFSTGLVYACTQVLVLADTSLAFKSLAASILSVLGLYHLGACILVLRFHLTCGHPYTSLPPPPHPLHKHSPCFPHALSHTNHHG